VKNTVWAHVSPPSPALGLASYSTLQLMDAQGPWAWVDGTWMDLIKCTLAAGLRHDHGYRYVSDLLMCVLVWWHVVAARVHLLM
jgi:hypothetical protein